MIEITKHEISLRTGHWLIELYKSALTGSGLEIWVDRRYFLLHSCIYRCNLKIQWWKGKK